MPVVDLASIVRQPFKGGATYQTIVGDDTGTAPIRLGVQTSPPGYKTALHSHPYLETITVLEGEGEAWLDDGSDHIVVLKPGMTLVLPPHQCHWFRATGDRALVTIGVHASAERIVHVHDE